MPLSAPPAANAPLARRRILVLRSRAQSSALADQLLHLGATPLLIPVLEIAPLPDTSVLDHALHHLRTFDLVLVTSGNAVSALAARLAALGLAPPLPRLAAIGPSTAAALQQAGLAPTPPLLPPVAVAESLADTLVPEVHALLRQQGSAHLLLVRAEHARDVLPDRLRSAGATLTIAPAYRNTIPLASQTALANLFRSPATWPDAIPFTSSSTVTHLLELLAAASLALPPEIPRISIGPVTSQTLREHGLPPLAEADAPTVHALVQAVRRTLTPPTA